MRGFSGSLPRSLPHVIFDGNRWNDLHYTNAVKRAAQSRKMVEVGL